MLPMLLFGCCFVEKHENIFLRILQFKINIQNENLLQVFLIVQSSFYDQTRSIRL